MLIKIENGAPVGFPVLEENFRYLFPKEVFPLVLTNAIVEPFGYAMYDFSQQPEITWTQERVEVTPVKDEYGIWRQKWEVRELTGAALQQKVAEQIKICQAQVDREVDRIYSVTIGGRSTEYLLAESEAKDYAAASYSGEVPITVQELADIKGWTPKQAADDVIAAANAWRSAQIVIRRQRLSTKDQLGASTSPEQINTIMLAWASFFQAISQQLAD